LRRLARRLAEDTLSKGTDMDDARPPVRSRKWSAEPVGWDLAVDRPPALCPMVRITTVVHYYCVHRVSYCGS